MTQINGQDLNIQLNPNLTRKKIKCPAINDSITSLGNNKKKIWTSLGPLFTSFFFFTMENFLLQQNENKQGNDQPKHARKNKKQQKDLEKCNKASS